MKKPLLILVAALAIGGGAVGLAAAFLGDSSAEEQAREAGHDVKTSVLGLDAVPRAIVNGGDARPIKLVADAETDRLLGAHLLAPHAGEVIQAAVLAIKSGLTVRDLSETFHP